MRVSSVWGTLTVAQKNAWRVWARDNPVMISPGVVRRVGGAKAFTIVEENRRRAGEARKCAAKVEARWE